MPTWPPLDRWDDAVAFAARHHGAALRKGTRVPYLTHPMIVAETLAYRYPERDELVLAGLLHDVVEDTEATSAMVAAAFGPRVADLVRAVSKDDDAMVAATGLPIPDDRRPDAEAELWRRRRAFMLGHLEGPTVDPDVLRLKAADALANLNAVARDLANPAVGAAVWSRFKVGRADSLGYYGAIAAAVRRGLGSEPLGHDLEAALSAAAATGAD
jgi:(p)ppGpp synthase/HD superfamily hydrolase